MKPKILCLLGPSGSGKTAICESLINHDPSFVKIKTTTTRLPRIGEDENSYFFLTKNEFEQGIKEGIFLEYSNYAGELYGTPRLSVDAELEDGKTVLAVVDINGIKAYKEFYGDRCCSVFIHRNKQTIIEAIMERDIPLSEKSKRIVQLDKEFDGINYCDKCIINNGSLDDAVKQLQAIAKD